MASLFEAEKTLNAAHVRKHQLETIGLVEAMANVDILPEKRKADIKYRSAILKMTVSSLAQQVQYAYAAAIRSIGVCTGAIPLLFCEDMLISVGAGNPYKATLPAILFKDAKSCRAKHAQRVQDENATSGDMILATTRKHAADLALLDAFFQIDAQIVEDLVGSGVQARMVRKILEVCPSAERHLSASDAVQRLRALQASPWGKMADKDSQNKLACVITMITAIAEERCPDIAVAEANIVLQPVVNTFQYFIEKVKVVSGKGQTAAEFLHGRQAVAHHFDRVDASDKAGKLDKSDTGYQLCKTFAFLLSAEQRLRLEEWHVKLEQAQDAEVRVAKARRLAGKSSKGAASASGGKSYADKAMSRASALFD